MPSHTSRVDFELFSWSSFGISQIATYHPQTTDRPRHHIPRGSLVFQDLSRVSTCDVDLFLLATSAEIEILQPTRGHAPNEATAMVFTINSTVKQRTYSVSAVASEVVSVSKAYHWWIGKFCVGKSASNRFCDGHC